MSLLHSRFTGSKAKRALLPSSSPFSGSSCRTLGGHFPKSQVKTKSEEKGLSTSSSLQLPSRWSPTLWETALCPEPWVSSHLHHHHSRPHLTLPCPLGAAQSAGKESSNNTNDNKESLSFITDLRQEPRFLIITSYWGKKSQTSVCIHVCCGEEGGRDLCKTQGTSTDLRD